MDSSRQLLHVENSEKIQWQQDQLQSWSAFFSQSLSSLFTTCLGARKAARTQPTSHISEPTFTEEPKTQEGREPLLDGKPLRMPCHAASSFLKTGTSRLIREANEVI